MDSFAIVRAAAIYRQEDGLSGRGLQDHALPFALSINVCCCSIFLVLIFWGDLRSPTTVAIIAAFIDLAGKVTGCVAGNGKGFLILECGSWHEGCRWLSRPIVSMQHWYLNGKQAVDSLTPVSVLQLGLYLENLHNIADKIRQGVVELDLHEITPCCIEMFHAWPI